MDLPDVFSHTELDIYEKQSILEQNIHTTAILCKNKTDGKYYEIRSYANENVFFKAKELTQNIKKLSSKELDERMVYLNFYEIRNSKKSTFYYTTRIFHSRNLSTLTFFSDTLFPDEKHALCLQVAKIYTLFPEYICLPFLPSRFLVHEDLYVQFTDLFDPNPIDDEAFSMGFYESLVSVDQPNFILFVNLIAKVWDCSQDEAELYIENYFRAIQIGLDPEKYKDEIDDLDEKYCPKWGIHFLNIHRKRDLSEIHGIPPLLVFDIHRVMILSKNTKDICTALSLISGDIDMILSKADELDVDEFELHQIHIKKDEMIRKRVVPIIKEISDCTTKRYSPDHQLSDEEKIKNQNIDLISALSFLIITKLQKHDMEFEEEKKRFNQNNSRHQNIRRNLSESLLIANQPKTSRIVNNHTAQHIASTTYTITNSQNLTEQLTPEKSANDIATEKKAESLKISIAEDHNSNAEKKITFDNEAIQKIEDNDKKEINQILKKESSIEKINESQRLLVEKMAQMKDNDNQDIPSKADLGFMEKLYTIIKQNQICSRFILECILPQIISLNPQLSQDILQTLLNSNAKEDQDLIITKLLHIFPKIESKTFKIQLIEQLKPCESLYTTLQSLDPSTYNPDLVLARMAAQLFTQAQVRFLIHVSEIASQAMILRFSLADAYDAPTLTSLVRALILRLTKRVHPANLAALTPLYKGSNKIPPITPEPLPISVLEDVQPLIAKFIVPSQKPHFRPLNHQIYDSHPVSIFTHKAKAICFTTDGQYLIAVGNYIELFRTESIKQHAIDMGRLKETLQLPEESTCVCSIFGSVLIGTNKHVYSFTPKEPFTDIEPCLEVPSPVLAIERIDDSLFTVLSLEDGSIYGGYTDSLRYMFKVPPKYGKPISICSLNHKNRYLIGTSDGFIILCCINTYCPLKIIRLSNMPCRLSRNDNKTFLATAGPYCSAIDKELNKIITNYAQPPAHVAFCTCVDRTVVTAHTDYAILSWVDGIITNLLDCTESRPSMEYTWYATPSKAFPLHTSPIISLIGSPTMTAAISLDCDGQLIVWSTYKEISPSPKK